MFKNTLITIFRLFIKYKAYSLTNLIGLATGLATFILILLFVQYELSYDDFHKNAENIYRLEPHWTGQGIDEHWAATSGNIIPNVAEKYPEIISSVKFYNSSRASVIKYENKNFRETKVIFADSTFLDMFSFKLIRGNKNDALAGPEKVVITENTANRYFGDSDPMGKFLRSEDRSYMVTGVMENVPENSHVHFDMVISLDELRSRWDNLDGDGPSAFYSFIRLQDENSAVSLKRKLEEDIWEIFGFTVTGDSANIPEGYEAELIMNPIQDIHLKGHAEKELESNGNIQYIYIFTIVALFVLIIACINYMNLATARSAMRGKEIGVKKVLGANRKSIFNQFMSESFLMSFIALVIALLMVEIAVPFFNDFTGLNLDLNLFGNSALSYSLLFIWLLVSFLSGSYPAMILSRFNPLKVLFSTSFAAGNGNASLYLRRSLVVFQFTISILLIIGVFSIYKQLEYIQNKNLGFDKEQVLVIPYAGRMDHDKVEVFKNEIAVNPEIISSSGTNSVPGVRIHMLPFRFPDLVESNPEEYQEGDDYVGMRSLSSDVDIFKTLGLELLEGEEFSSLLPTEAEKAFILNEAAVKELELKNPVGKRIDYIWGLEEPLNGHIIGIVKDFHYASLHTEVEPLVIMVNPPYNRYLSIRLQTDNIPESLERIEQSWFNTFPGIPFDHFFLEASYDNMYKTEMNMASIILLFTILAIIIACLGLFGLASYITEQRTKEIGIRKVLGASIIKIIQTLSKEFVILVLVANVLAWFPAWYFLNDWLDSFTFRTGLSWWLFVTAGFISLLIAMLIVGVQSYRAGRMNPVQAIKAE